MDFELSEPQKLIKMAAREFAEGEFKEIASDCDVKGGFPKELIKKAGSLGFIGVSIKEEYGGPGLGLLEEAFILEEFWRVDPGLGNLFLASYGSDLIQTAASEEQKREYLPSIAKGDRVIGLALREPQGMDRLSLLRTEARKARGGYVINGTKALVINGTIADSLLVVCLTDPHSVDPQRRHSLFLSKNGSEGIHATSYPDKLGIRATDLVEVSFDNVYVPLRNLIGEEGDASTFLDAFLLRAGIYACAMGTGLSNGALDQAVRYSKLREAFDRPIGFFQGIHLKLAEMATMVEALRHLSYRAAWEIDRGNPDPKHVAMAKWLAGEVSGKVTAETIQIHGGYGYTKDLDPERFYRDAQFVRIFQGTAELDKTLIARSLLGESILGDRERSQSNLSL